MDFLDPDWGESTQKLEGTRREKGSDIRCNNGKTHIFLRRGSPCRFIGLSLIGRNWERDRRDTG